MRDLRTIFRVIVACLVQYSQSCSGQWLSVDASPAIKMIFVCLYLLLAPLHWHDGWPVQRIAIHTLCFLKILWLVWWPDCLWRWILVCIIFPPAHWIPAQMLLWLFHPWGSWLVWQISCWYHNHMLQKRVHSFKRLHRKTTRLVRVQRSLCCNR